MRVRLAERDLDGEVEVDSAGTGDWHIGDPPDERATTAAAARRIELAGQARQVTGADFERFDLIVAMDRANERDLLALAPPGAEGKVSLLRSWDDRSASAGELDVPDPYWSGPDGFDHVLDVVESACSGLVEDLAARLGRSAGGRSA